MKTALRIAAAAATFLVVLSSMAVPANAYETYNRDNSWAKSSGKVWIDDNKSIGFNLYATDDARDGECVYFQWQGVRNDAPDTGWFRLTTNTCGKGTTNRYYDDHKKVIGTYTLPVNGFRVRICKDVNNRVDPCASASYVATRGQYTRG